MSTTSFPYFRLALAGATLLMLAGCGNKGPLVMPQKPVPVEAQPVPEPAGPATQDPQTEPTTTEPAAASPQPSSGNER
ncbi:sugar transporter [Xanthomonas sp. Kuri4-1]